MVRQRIFISHCTKQDEPEAAAFLAAIEAGIQAHPDRFDLRVDRLKLEPGDDWRHELYTWMDQADGAVVIIGRNALESNFVPIELSFLSIRAHLDKAFPLIPVLLPGITRENAKTGFAGALDLKRLQFVREATAEAAAARMVERLVALFEDVPLSLDKWQNELIRKIGHEFEALKLDQAVLEEIGVEVGWEDVRRSFRTPAHLRLASRRSGSDGRHARPGRCRLPGLGTGRARAIPD